MFSVFEEKWIYLLVTKELDTIIQISRLEKHMV